MTGIVTYETFIMQHQMTQEIVTNLCSMRTNKVTVHFDSSLVNTVSEWATSAKAFPHYITQPVCYAQNKHSAMTDKDTVMRLSEVET